MFMFLRWVLIAVNLTVFVSLGGGLWAKTAYQTYADLSEEGVTFEERPLMIENPALNDKGEPGNGGKVSYGAEKEGVSLDYKNHKLILVAGPSNVKLDSYVNKLDSLGRTTNRKHFLQNFLDAIYNGEDGIDHVIDNKGGVLTLDYSKYRNANFFKMSSHKVYQVFKEWLGSTYGNPFSFISVNLRTKLFNGDFLEKTGGSKVARGLKGTFRQWVPLYGPAQNYIMAVTNKVQYGGFKEIGFLEYGGWEINFTPLKSYGKYERMLAWFNETLDQKVKKDQNKEDAEMLAAKRPLSIEDESGQDDDYYSQGDLKGAFTAPGHQRLVWAIRQFRDESEKNKYYQKVGELFKNVHAIIVLKMMASGNGIETGMWKQIHTDNQVGSLSTWKGPIRMEMERFSKNSMGVEIRTGMKDVLLQRFLHKAIASRVGSNDWTGILDNDQWELIPKSLFSDNVIPQFTIFPDTLPIDRAFREDMIFTQFVERIAMRFDLQKEDVAKFIHLTTTKGSRKSMRRMVKEYIVPFWMWENAPFIDQNKKKYLKALTKDLVLYVNSRSENITGDDIIDSIRTWVRHANLQRDIEFYLLPKRAVKENENLTEFPFNSSGKINYNVNDVYFGVEYTGQYPTKRIAEFSHTVPTRWLETTHDLDPEERVALFERVAISLSKNLGNINPASPENVQRFVDKGAHGHGLSITFKIKDPQGRGNWKAEWDGIGRSYHSSGDVVAGSYRGGHIEIVTPKIRPTMKDIMAVFKTYKDNSLIPSHHNGGGHVNIDLAPFDGKPRELARFMSIFHRYQNTIAMMFQHPTRLKAAQPYYVSKEFHQKLLDFKGTEQDLKQFLYNERYFNKRIGRKSRYLQLNMTAYYQDVIPEKFITKDYDIKNPAKFWHPEFKEEPKIRKMEFRLMNSAESEFESAMQIRLVRAMLHKALNNNEPIVGEPQQIDFDLYVGTEAKQKKSMSDLREMCSFLGLSYEDYKFFMSEGMSRYQVYRRSIHYKSLSERLMRHPEYRSWGKAVSMRSMENAINSEDAGREAYDPAIVNNEPLIFAYQKQEAAGLNEADQQRTMMSIRKKDALRNGRNPLPYFSRRDVNLGLQDESLYNHYGNWSKRN